MIRFVVTLLAFVSSVYGQTPDCPVPSPSCAWNNMSCPIPRGWDTDWSIINSTAMMATVAGSFDGFNPGSVYKLV